ncbi:cytochrome P450 [Choiromyces venosus 120613-1]|uniref:Cytochrome P450 n=1 Tax=Choiromyces venosus 120613-1 TaxID=1336337 RepID=A0A3N4J5X9_9PEZI|nr:cytochrome P450 [Choiromyces venosus 120613-1]
MIKEIQRVSSAVQSRLPRIVDRNGITLAGTEVPPGTIVGMSLHQVHHDPKIFPSPEVFNPERWLGDNAKRLENYYVPYSRVGRQCLAVS